MNGGYLMASDDEKKRTDDRNYSSQEGGLAGAGGGRITNGGPPIGHGAAPETDEDRKRVDPNATDTPGDTGAINASDKPAHGNLGGRNPGQAARSIGDRDSTYESSGLENGPIDPMTSRAPDKVNSNAKSDAAKQKK
jgi:hypothetical protein